MRRVNCDELEIYHSWEDITPNEFYATYPVSFPVKTEKCRNCNKVRKLITKQTEIKEWVVEEYRKNKEL